MQLITRREFMAAGAAAPLAAAERPNVLFLMSDEHSPHVAGWMGNRIVQTPALDRLAAQGVAFTAAYCQNPICVPSRASFVTGRMASNVGVFDNSGGLDRSAVTLADVFGKSGYTTAWFGKTHWGGNPRFQIQPGRDGGARDGHEEGRSRLPQDAIITKQPVSAEVDTLAQQQTLQFLREQKGKPFFCGVSFIKPHFPFIVQEEYYRRYKDIIDVPEVTPRMIEDLPRLSRAEREKYGFASLTREQIAKARAVYYGMVTFIDDLVGGILKQLDQQGLRRNTIVLYTADHGELAGEHGLWYKNSFYEGSVRIPHIWSIPGRKGGRKVSVPTMNMDIFPTLCDLCGVEKPGELEGSSLLPLLDGKDDGRQRHALSENYRGGEAARMIRRGQWKYCYFHNDREQLFDLAADPGEVVNLAGKPEHQALQEDLKKLALASWKMERPRARKKKG
jgi:choline-sulfatase